MPSSASAMMEMRQDRIALDLQSARTIDPLSGHMHVAQTNISKATVNPYLGQEIPGSEQLGLNPDKTYNLLRDPEELAAAAKSFNGKPLVLAHRAQAVDDGDHENRVGSIANVIYEHPYLKGDLSIWSKAAIEAIESGAQRELSCGYGYEFDPTPGEYEGVKFDGVMRKLNGNHLALVREGRAGADCHVFDSLETILMNKAAVHTRASIGAPIALAVLMKPKLAADAKIDWSPLFKGVTAKNFKASKQRMAADIKRQANGKLAKDANLDDVVELLDKLEEVIPGEGPDVEFKKVEDLPDPDKPAEDADDAELRAFLKTLGLSDEDIDKACAMASAPVAAEDDDNDGSSGSGTTTFTTSGTEAVGAEKGGSSGPGARPFAGDKAAMDAQFRTLQRTVAGMDAKITQARKDGAADAIRTQREIYEALDFVRPWVGKLSLGMDSAEEVYRTALTTLGKDVEKVHADALRPILEAQPKPGERRSHVPAHIAQDAAQQSDYEKRFGDNATRLKH